MNCYSLTGSSVHGISQARRLEWVVMIRWILKIWKGLTSINVISSVHLFSYVRLFVTSWTAAHQGSLSITNSRSWLNFMSIMLVMPSKHLILCYPLLPPSVFPSIRVFSSELVLLIRWPKYWSFSFSISLSNEYSGLISFRIGWFDLLAVQGTLKSLLQNHSSKASVLRHSAFLIVQLSYPYINTGKTMALTRWAFVSKVRSLLFNALPRFAIAFLPRNKCLLISWLRSLSAVILEPSKVKSVTVSPSVCHEQYPCIMPISLLVYSSTYPKMLAPSLPK